MIKTQENFNSYSLSNLYNILKAHEVEVKETADENDKTSFGGPLALISKTNVKDACSDDVDGKSEEGVIVNSDDEAVAYYSNNNVKKVYKKSIKGNFKNNSFKKVASTSNHGVQNKKDESSGEKKSEKKLVGDSGYDCNYCNGKNHLARDCMLKKEE